MLPIISLLLVITLSILITRVATVALTLTGLSREAARFQARSALSGTGFTTTEAENVVRHPVRRRVILLLMLLGNAGIVTAASTLIIGFVGEGGGTPLWLKVAILIAGVSALWTAAQSHWVDRRLSRLIEWALKRYTSLDVRDYSSLLHLGGEYKIVELEVGAGNWLAHKTLAESRLRDEGVLVLGIERTGTYLGAPRPDRQILPGDLLLLYGRVATLAALDQRRADAQGVAEHREAVVEQKKVIAEEEARDRASRPPA